MRVARGGRTLFEGAYGLADRERLVPNAPRTQFRVGSMYEMVTAVATLQLVRAQRGRAGDERRPVLEPGGEYVVVALSNLDPPAATQVAACILDRRPTATPP